MTDNWLYVSMQCLKLVCVLSSSKQDSICHFLLAIYIRSPINQGLLQWITVMSDRKSRYWAIKIARTLSLLITSLRCSNRRKVNALLNQLIKIQTIWVTELSGATSCKTEEGMGPSTKRPPLKQKVSFFYKSVRNCSLKCSFVREELV